MAAIRRLRTSFFRLFMGNFGSLRPTRWHLNRPGTRNDAAGVTFNAEELFGLGDNGMSVHAEAEDL